jgi:hypothetical protein
MDNIDCGCTVQSNSALQNCAVLLKQYFSRSWGHSQLCQRANRYNVPRERIHLARVEWLLITSCSYRCIEKCNDCITCMCEKKRC